MPVVEAMETATLAAREFLEVCAVFVAVGGLWFGFHGVGDFLGIGTLRLTEGDRTQSTSVSLICLLESGSYLLTLPRKNRQFS
jgi:hypothetical protein